MFFLLTIGMFNSDVGSGFPAWALVLIIGVALGVVVFLTTRSPGPPRYYLAFVPFAFVLSVCWVYVVANELVSLLQVRAVRVCAC